MDKEQGTWNFPLAAGGISHGYMEAGTATFSGKVIPSLVREMCQNSLDARVKDSSEPVRMEFERYLIDPKNIPGRQRIDRELGTAIVHFGKQASEETRDYLLNMKQLLQKRFLPVLRVSDYGTRGLDQAYEDATGGWYRLTKQDGGGTKSGEDGGSFGIGKNAAFAASDLRMVFYRTQTNEPSSNGRAAQGILHLPAYPTKPNSPLTTQTLGIGYFGAPILELEKPRTVPTGYGHTKTVMDTFQLQNAPVSEIALLDRVNERTEVGTDVFLFGFCGESDWMTRVAEEALESFLLAIYRGKLEITIRDGRQSLVINRNTIPQFMTGSRAGLRNARSYWRVLTEPENVTSYELPFHGLGTLKLQLLTDPEATLNRKVLMTRSNDMKICALDRMPQGMQFTGIFTLDGPNLNEYFRAMETPAHDKWEPERYRRDPKQAKQLLGEARNWVKEKIRETAAAPISESMEIKGLSKSLHTRSKEEGLGLAEGAEGAQHGAQTPAVQVRVRRPTPDPANMLVNRSGSSGADPEGNGQEGTLAGSGSDPLPRQNPSRKSASGKSRRKKRSTGSAKRKNASGDGPHVRAVPVLSARLLRERGQVYRLILRMEEPADHGSIRIRIIGENEEPCGEVLPLGARMAEGSCWLGVEGSHIRFQNLRADETIRARLLLDAPANYALGVAVYEDR